MRVALEFVPFTGVPDLTAALALLAEVDRPNAGHVVDLGHHIRSGGRPHDLRALEPDRVFTVQLADGPGTQPADLLDEAMSYRYLPGSGEFPLLECLRVLADIGVRAPTGPRSTARSAPTGRCPTSPVSSTGRPSTCCIACDDQRRAAPQSIACRSAA